MTWLKRTAPAIGLAEHYAPRTEMLSLSEGDVLLLYTDGLTEALNNEMKEFGQERLAAFLQNAAELSASEMLQVVRRGVSAHGDNVPLSDDLTLVAMKVLA